MMSRPRPAPPPPRAEKVEAEIVLHHRTIDYDTREYPVEVLVAKYTTGLMTDENELFVPDYQRELTWSEERQSKFIESVLIGLPIPYLFVADAADGRLEIVDGSQRIRTLARFVSSDLELTDLKKLPILNGVRFRDLLPSRQRRFSRHTLRMIELTEKANEEIRRDLFERINSGSQSLTDMEKRWGTNPGSFLEFVRRCSADPLFHRLAPLGDAAVKRREREEFVLRYFAYSDRYLHFKRRVDEFVDEYAKAHQDNFDESAMAAQWQAMLNFVAKYFPNGFSKAVGHTRTPRIRFESIAAGVTLALRAKPSLKTSGVDQWLNSPEFARLTTSGSSNSAPKIKERIEFVRNNLLGRR